ncbi:MAG: EpsG family protein [Lachnospiraceae bacterium]|nr:EpsG family protein [Lachnospiraceae bacterium]
MDYSIFIYLILTVVTVGLAFFVNLPAARLSMAENTGKLHSRQQFFNAVLVSSIFFLMFAVSACRIAVGNDYWVYRSDFLLIQQNRHVSFEPGFVLVVKFLQSMLDFDQYLPIFGFFSFFTVLFFVRGLYDQSEQFCYSLYLLLTAGYYFSSLNSVRYYLVLSIAMFSVKYVLSDEWLKFVLWIGLAACFHKSVLVVIPLYFLASRNWKKWHMILLALGCASLILFQDLYRKIIFFFYPFYEGSMFDTGETSLTNVARCAAVLVFSLLYFKSAIKDDKKNSFYFYCNLGALVLYVFASFIPEISRIGYYLNITNVFLIPGILVKIENKKQQCFWTIVIGLAFLAYFALFLRSCYSTDIRILPYRNWIFQ